VGKPKKDFGHPERRRRKRITVNYKRMMDGKDLDSNIVLKAGDTVVVP
jgi:hypothetical protein